MSGEWDRYQRLLVDLFDRKKKKETTKLWTELNDPGRRENFFYLPDTFMYYSNDTFVEASKETPLWYAGPILWRKGSWKMITMESRQLTDKSQHWMSYFFDWPNELRNRQQLSCITAYYCMKLTLAECGHCKGTSGTLTDPFIVKKWIRLNIIRF